MTATAVGTRRSTLWLFALLLAVALWWWWQQHGQARQTAPELPLELREEPDLSASDAVIRQYNDSGAQRYQLHATSIDHYAAEPLTRLRDPKLTLFNASGKPSWRATADFGYIRSRPGPDGLPEEVVYLRESVVLTQQLPPPSHLVLQTSAMYLYLARELVETDETVNIASSFGQSRAAHLIGDLRQGLLHLKGARRESQRTPMNPADPQAPNQVETVVRPDQFK